MTGRGDSLSTAAPNEFMAISIAPPTIPYIVRATVNASSESANPINGSAAHQSIEETIKMRRPSKYANIQPVIGMESMAPAALPNSANPSAPVCACKCSRTCGMRDTQVASTSP